jgi:hypothetical protein
MTEAHSSERAAPNSSQHSQANHLACGVRADIASQVGSSPFIIRKPHNASSSADGQY